MLSTFENAGRQHLRRKERERHLKHLRQMEEFAKSCEFDGLPACSLADAVSGCPLQKAPEQLSVNKVWWKKPAIVLSLTLVLCLVLIGFLVGVDFGEHENAQAQKADDRSSVMSPSNLRRETLSSLILDWGLTSSERLEDGASPAFLALDWLVFTDVESVASETVRTRFALACLYFATQNPKLGNKWDADNYWLSSYPVCDWFGVDCLDLGENLGLVGSLNLSSNALTGTIPAEIGLLELDITALDLSENHIGGTIPESIFLLRNLGKPTLSRSYICIKSSHHSTEDLYLGPNSLSGSLAGQIGKFENIKQIYINDCSLTGFVPDELGSLSTLGTSGDDYRHATNIEQYLSRDPNLCAYIPEALGLHNNGFVGSLPVSLTQMTNLGK